jgi:hypothetical protein
MTDQINLNYVKEHGSFWRVLKFNATNILQQKERHHHKMHWFSLAEDFLHVYRHPKKADKIAALKRFEEYYPGEFKDWVLAGKMFLGVENFD